MDSINQKLIDRFLLGDLNANEEAKFLEKLESDQEFKSLYESSKEAFNHMELFAEGDLRNEMAEWDKEDAVDPVDLPKKKFPIKKLIIAITALLLLSAISFYVLKPKADPIMIAEAAYDPDFSTLRSADDDPFENVKMILERKQESSYNSIGEALGQIPKTSESYGEAQYYLGHIAYQQKEFDKARQYFQLASSSTSMKDKAEWYEVLCYVHLGDDEKYSTGLKMIGGDEGHGFQKEAERLLGELGN